MQTNKKTNKNFNNRINRVKDALNKEAVKIKKPKKEVPIETESIIIVDAQDDFGKPGGALYVEGGEKIKDAIIDYVNNNKKRINQIIFTRDWHTKKDESFEKNGGQWPVHCVQNTDGAQIMPELWQALVETRIPINVVNKGTVFDHEEYGAFEHCGTFHHLHPNDPPSIKNCYFANVESSSGCRILNNNIVICGIAGDYCVKETMKNLMKHWKKFNISVLMGGVVSIDGGIALNEFIEVNNIKKI